MNFAQALVSGLLTGFVFALIAAGLTLIFGVMEIVNFAHGEFLMLSMYLSYFFHASLGWDPLLALPLNAAALFVLGVVVYFALIRRVLKAPMLAQIFATFGLGVFLQNLAQFLWRPDFRTLGDTWVSGRRIALGGVFVSGPQLVAAGGAVLTTGLLWFLLSRTSTGRALLATAEDRQAAALMGIDPDRMFALAWGIGAACVGVAGALLSTFYLRLSAGRLGVRADRVRGGGAGRIRLGAGSVRGRHRHRRGRVDGGRVRRAGGEEFVCVCNLSRRRAGAAARPAGEVVKRFLAAAAVLVVLAWPLVFRGPYPQHLMILVLLNALLGTAWNILGGFAGQISLGQAIFFGTGAYTSTLLAQHAGISPWFGLLAGALVAAALALAIGTPCFRLSGHYFAIATIALGEIAAIAVTNWDFAGGAVGLFLSVGDTGLRQMNFESKLGYHYLIAGLLALALAVTVWLRSARAGYYWRAIREDQAAARSAGVPATRYKMLAIAVSAALTAMAGTFYAQYVLFIDPPSVLPLSLSIQICLVAVLGGAGTVAGPLVGAAVLVPLSAATSVLLGGSGRSLDLVVYGALIMIIAVFEPSGLVGLARRVLRSETFAARP